LVTLSSEAMLWLTIDAMLLTAFGILLLRFLKKLRGRKRVKRKNLPRIRITSRFEESLRSHGGRQAIAETLPMLLEAVASRSDLSTPKSSTSKELLLAITKQNLPENAKKVLDEMYRLYEPTRFWNHSPDPEETSSFGRGLQTIEELLNKVEG
jgi:hypothetical protein